jgi:hypothetical protein
VSDHVDGPRSIGDPAADVTDLFAFTSAENPARTVLALCAFPSAGEDALFSNVVDYSIVVRRVSIAAVGNASKFQPANDEIRFKFRFEVLKRDAAGKAVQGGVCTLPSGRELRFAVNDEKGASTPEGEFRVFAGLRSDPFYLAWIVGELKKVPNLLQHDNVLCILVEFNTRRVLDVTKASLFGVIAETVPIRQPPGALGYPVRRIDWVGRPEQTNMRLNNPAMEGIDDLRDLWNQQPPFAIPMELRPLFLQRLKDSIATWDGLDGRTDWMPDALAATANVFLDDFLLLDVAKPITDQSHLEIEKSTIDGRPYQTGGGRTIDANVIDILLTWLVNRDREFLQGGATGATKPGTRVFPYFATPNTEVQVVADSVELAAEAGSVWAVMGRFSLDWHPAVANVTLIGAGIGQLRVLRTLVGKEIIERLVTVDEEKRRYSYALVSGVAAKHYVGTLDVKAKGTGTCIATWRVEFLADSQPDVVVRGTVTHLIETGLGSLRRRFGP